MEKYSMADFELYYFITDDDLFPAEAAMQVFLPRVRAAVVTLAIWNAHLRLHFEGMREDFALYIPKRPISLLSTEEFQNGMSEILDQDKRPRLEALNGPLMAWQQLSDLWPSGPAANTLHLIVVPSMWACPLYEMELLKRYISSSPATQASTLKRT